MDCKMNEVRAVKAEWKGGGGGEGGREEGGRGGGEREGGEKRRERLGREGGRGDDW